MIWQGFNRHTVVLLHLNSTLVWLCSDLHSPELGTIDQSAIGRLCPYSIWHLYRLIQRAASKQNRGNCLCSMMSQTHGSQYWTVGSSINLFVFPPGLHLTESVSKTFTLSHGQMYGTVENINVLCRTAGEWKKHSMLLLCWEIIIWSLVLTFNCKLWSEEVRQFFSRPSDRHAQDLPQCQARRSGQRPLHACQVIGLPTR